MLRSQRPATVRPAAGFYMPRRSSSSAARSLARKRCDSVRGAGAESLSRRGVSACEKRWMAWAVVNHREPMRQPSSLTRLPSGAFAPRMIQRSKVDRWVRLPLRAGGTSFAAAARGMVVSVDRSITVNPPVSGCHCLRAVAHPTGRTIPVPTRTKPVQTLFSNRIPKEWTVKDGMRSCCPRHESTIEDVAPALASSISGLRRPVSGICGLCS